MPKFKKSLTTDHLSTRQPIIMQFHKTVFLSMHTDHMKQKSTPKKTDFVTAINLSVVNVRTGSVLQLFADIV
jgi:hypothetical protein